MEGNKNNVIELFNKKSKPAQESNHIEVNGNGNFVAGSVVINISDKPFIQKKDSNTAKDRRIAYIQNNMKQLDIENRVLDYMEKHYGVRSLSDLPDLESLERVYRYVSGVKKNTITV